MNDDEGRIDGNTHEDWLYYLANCELREAFDRMLRLPDPDLLTCLYSLAPKAAQNGDVLRRVCDVLISDSSLARQACAVVVAFQKIPAAIPESINIDQVLVDLILRSAQEENGDMLQCREILEGLLIQLPYFDYDLSSQDESRLVAALEPADDPWIVEYCGPLLMKAWARRGGGEIAKLVKYASHTNQTLCDEAVQILADCGVLNNDRHR